MSIFSDKQKTIQQPTSASPSVVIRTSNRDSGGVGAVLTLQRSIGNYALGRMLDGNGSAGISAVGARVSRRANEGTKVSVGEVTANRAETLARQSVEGSEDELFTQVVLARSRDSETSSATSKQLVSNLGRQATPPALPQALSAIQRVANFASGSVHQVNNLATSILGGGAIGFTPPMLNGSIVLSTGDTRARLTRPTCVFSSSSSGGVDAQVGTVPTNTGSFDESVLAPGPWTTMTTKAVVGASFPSLTTCTGGGNSTFQAQGKPSDNHMFTANRRHEDHHANDHRSAFNSTILPWDTKLQNALDAGTKFNGANEAAAEAALHAAMGGTPDQIADAYFNEAVRLNNVFHGTPAGGNVTVEDPTANADCSTSSVKSHNPS